MPLILVQDCYVIRNDSAPESHGGRESVRQGVGVLEFVLHHGGGVIGGVDHHFFVQDA